MISLSSFLYLYEHSLVSLSKKFEGKDRRADGKYFPLWITHEKCSLNGFQLTAELGRSWTFHWMHLLGVSKISKIQRNYMRWLFFLMPKEKLLIRSWMWHGKQNGARKRFVSLTFRWARKWNWFVMSDKYLRCWQHFDFWIQISCLDIGFFGNLSVIKIRRENRMNFINIGCFIFLLQWQRTLPILVPLSHTHIPTYSKCKKAHACSRYQVITYITLSHTYPHTCIHTCSKTHARNSGPSLHQYHQCNLNFSNYTLNFWHYFPMPAREGALTSSSSHIRINSSVLGTIMMWRDKFILGFNTLFAHLLLEFWLFATQATNFVTFCLSTTNRLPFALRFNLDENCYFSSVKWLFYFHNFCIIIFYIGVKSSFHWTKIVISV